MAMEIGIVESWNLDGFLIQSIYQTDYSHWSFFGMIFFFWIVIFFIEITD